MDDDVRRFDGERRHGHIRATRGTHRHRCLGTSRVFGDADRLTRIITGGQLDDGVDRVPGPRLGHRRVDRTTGRGHAVAPPVWFDEVASGKWRRGNKYLPRKQRLLMPRRKNRGGYRRAEHDHCRDQNEELHSAAARHRVGHEMITGRGRARWRSSRHAASFTFAGSCQFSCG